MGGVEPLHLHPQVVFDFVEKRYPEIQTFNVEGAKVLPTAVVKEVHSAAGASGRGSSESLRTRLPFIVPSGEQQTSALQPLS